MSLETVLKMEGLLALTLWDVVMCGVGTSCQSSKVRPYTSHQNQNTQHIQPHVSTHTPHVPYLSACFIFGASSFNGNPDLTVHLFLVWKSSGIHARDLETQRRPNGPIIHLLQERQKAKPRRRVKGVTEDCKDGAGDWLVQNFELNKDSTCVNFQSSLIEPISVTKCSKQVRQSQQNRGLMDLTNLGKDRWWEHSQGRRSTQIITIRGGNLSQDHRSPFSVVAALVPSVHEMTKRNHRCVDDVSKFEGASSK